MGYLKIFSEKDNTLVERQENSWNGKRKKTIQDARILAKSYNGKCLSVEYLNNSTKLVWQCSEGHIFESTYGNVSQNHWCRMCFNKIAGSYHYMFSSKFHSSNDDFEKRLLWDSIKKKVCKERNVFLIEIPYTIHVKDIDNFIKNELKSKGVIWDI